LPCSAGALHADGLDRGIESTSRGALHGGMGLAVFTDRSVSLEGRPSVIHYRQRDRATGRRMNGTAVWRISRHDGMRAGTAHWRMCASACVRSQSLPAEASLSYLRASRITCPALLGIELHGTTPWRLSAHRIPGSASPRPLPAWTQDSVPAPRWLVGSPVGLPTPRWAVGHPLGSADLARRTQRPV
jgi:hypothetical protein